MIRYVAGALGVSLCLALCVNCGEKPNASQSGRYATVELGEGETRFDHHWVLDAGIIRRDNSEDFVWCCARFSYILVKEHRDYYPYDSLTRASALQAAEILRYSLDGAYNIRWHETPPPQFQRRFEVIVRRDSSVAWCCASNLDAARRIEDALEAQRP